MNVDNGDSKFDCHGIKMNNKQKVKDKELRYMMGGWAVFSYFKQTKKILFEKKKKADKENASVGFM